jgi:hypothetical protein
MEWRELIWPGDVIALAADHDVVVQQMRAGGAENFDWWITRTAECIDAWAGGVAPGLNRPVARGTAATMADGMARATAAAERLGLVRPAVSSPAPGHDWEPQATTVRDEITAEPPGAVDAGSSGQAAAQRWAFEHGLTPAATVEAGDLEPGPEPPTQGFDGLGPEL